MGKTCSESSSCHRDRHRCPAGYVAYAATLNILGFHLHISGRVSVNLSTLVLHTLHRARVSDPINPNQKVISQRMPALKYSLCAHLPLLLKRKFQSKNKFFCAYCRSYVWTEWKDYEYMLEMILIIILIELLICRLPLKYFYFKYILYILYVLYC